MNRLDHQHLKSKHTSQKERHAAGMDSIKICQCLHTLLGHIGRTSKLYRCFVSTLLLALLTHLCSGDGSTRYCPKHPSFAKDKADGVHYLAAAYIMDDDLESAEAGLASGDSSFHKVCA